MDTWVRYQVSLELCQIHIQGTIKPQGGSDGGYNLTNQTIQIGVGWSLDVQVPSAYVIDSLVVHHEGTVRVLQGGMCGQDGVVWLNNSCGNLGCWVDGKFQFRLLTVIDGETLHEEGGETRPSASTKAVEDEETLKTGALVCQLPNSVQHKIDDFFPNCVVTTSIVVGSILFPCDQLFGMEELTVGASPDLIYEQRKISKV
ncbi:hypothetical protein HOLleu_32721 [Holothuria leucospilota]|uniref:Uncharacterized protein n=1 Tax=Holothuria leucospilota TaxID=206669 RepID=A0A9Q1GY95_HOLLE|nr:hypothetical protein HOLleu_32721 [Holothuria leucospilota]